MSNGSSSNNSNVSEASDVPAEGVEDNKRACSVCHKTFASRSSSVVIQLQRCSRCKDDAYRVCSRTCQARDWKRHKREDCYVYNAVLEQVATQSLKNMTQKECPFCRQGFTKRDVVRAKLQGLPCQHVVHVHCLKTKNQSETDAEKEKKKGAKQQPTKKNKLETVVQCPLCRARAGPARPNNAADSTTGYYAKPWYQEDSVLLFHMALGYAFQAELGGTVEEEKQFIESRFRATIQAGQRDLALHTMTQARHEFQALLPTLRGLGSTDERMEKADAVAEKVALALGMFFFPATLDGQHDLIMAEQQKWRPHIQDWMETLQLYGPYIWAG